MALAAGESESGGFARDPDHRLLVVPQAEGGGPLEFSAVVGMSAVNAIAVSGFDLSSQLFSQTSSLPDDYVLNKVEFSFSTTQSRTITVTRADGSVLFSDTNTSRNVELENIDEAIEGGENFTVAVSQTSGACLLTCRAVATTGTSPPLSGTNVAASQAGAWTVGQGSPPWQTTGGLVKDPNNSTTTPLAAGAVFTGAATDLTNWSGLTYNLYADPDQMATPPVLAFQFSPDGTNWDVFVPATIGNGHIFIPVPLRPVMQYFRIQYFNGSANQTAFRLTTYLHRTVPDALVRTGIQTLQPSDPVTVVRALLEPGFKGRLSLLSADRSIGGEAITAPYIVQDKAQFDAPFANNNLTVVTSGGGTAVQAAATGATLTSANAAGASQAQLQGTKKIRYSPGRETREEVTLAFPAAGLANSDVVAGLTDTPSNPLGAGNGILVGYNGATFGLHIVSGGAVTTIPKSAWNGDLLDGSGLSEFRDVGIPQALDLTKANAYRIRFVWYGVGPVYLEVKSPDDKWVIAHILTYPNQFTVPYMQNPNVYLCWDVTKQAGAGAGTLTLRSFSASAGTVEPEIDFSPHEVHGHVQVQQAVAHVTTTPNTIYTVPSGRQLLVSSLALSALFGSANSHIEVRDGGATGTLLYSMEGGQANSTASQSPTFPTPLIFMTDVTVVTAGGTVTYSLSIAAFAKEL